MRAIERSKKEIEAGRLWRAREILSGSLPNYPFSPELYQEYGALLLRLGDLREAGRFLFLAGRDHEEHVEAIRLYLDQFTNADKNTLYYSFPARARLANLSDYPESTAAELKRRGFGEIIRHPAAPPQRETLKSKVLNGIFITILLAIVFLFLIGFVSFLGIGAKVVYDWINS